MIISVDHGNKSIKTPNTLFTSGLISSEGLQGFKTDYICWNGRYYTLTEQRISYLRDKTEDERFYVLTLFAIAKELERRKAAETLDPIDITLLIGLPPAHYEQLHSRFEQYFLRRREAIDFEYNGKYYSIRISKVLSYPQAFAAAVTQYSTLKTYSVAYIIDIGGFTIDVLKLRMLVYPQLSKMRIVRSLNCSSTALKSVISMWTSRAAVVLSEQTTCRYEIAFCVMVISWSLKALIVLAVITLEFAPSGNILPKRLVWTSLSWTRPFWIRPDTKICSVV